MHIFKPEAAMITSQGSVQSCIQFLILMRSLFFIA